MTLEQMEDIVRTVRVMYPKCRIVPDWDDNPNRLSIVSMNMHYLGWIDLSTAKVHWGHVER